MVEFVSRSGALRALIFVGFTCQTFVELLNHQVSGAHEGPVPLCPDAELPATGCIFVEPQAWMTIYHNGIVNGHHPVPRWES